MEIDSLITEEYQWILSQSRHYCRNTMDAEDLAGEVILKILSHKERYNPDKPFRPWCSTIILNTYITLYNRSNIIQFTEECTALHQSSGCNATDMIAIREIKECIRYCRHQSCTIDCVLLYAEGYSYEEISTLLRVSQGTVKSRISYGRHMLRKVYEYQ